MKKIHNLHELPEKQKNKLKMQYLIIFLMSIASIILIFCGNEKLLTLGCALLVIPTFWLAFLEFKIKKEINGCLVIMLGLITLGFYTMITSFMRREPLKNKK